MSEEVSIEKECDHELNLSFVDLTDYTSYLVIPSKYVNIHQRIIKRKKNKLELHYGIPMSYLSHKQIYHRKVREALDFFGIIRPNGEIDQFTVKRSDIVDGQLYVYTGKKSHRIGRIDDG